MLTELLAALGAATLFERHVPDNTERLVETFKSRLHGPDAVETNLLVVTGGVSAGQRDLVPAALKDAGVTPIFHKVALRPGKPLWFGVGPENNFGAPCLVFGLPGNPVSGLVCALLFIKPAIEVMSGRKPSPLIPTTAMLAEPYKHSGDRMSFLPALRVSDAIEVSRWSGSSDLRTVANADGFAVFDPGAQLYPRGHKVGFIPLPG